MWSRRAVLSTALATSAAVLLSSCAAPSTSSGRGRAPIRVGFAQTGIEGGWRTANTASVRSALSAPDFELVYVDAQEQQADQIVAVRSFITRGVDVIVLAPLVQTGWRDVLLEAHAAGIPVVLEDRAIESADAWLVRTRVGDDFTREGALAGEWVRSSLPTGVRMVQLLGTTGSTPAIERTRGFAAAVRGRGLVLLDAEDGGFTRSQGKAVMASFLERHGSRIELLFAQSDDMGLGAIEAIEEAGLVPGRDVRIVTIDATRDGLEELIAGRINHVVQCNPLLGPRVAQVVRDVHRGTPVRAHYFAQDRVFDLVAAKKVVASWPY